MRRGIGRLRAGGSGFNPASVFAGGAAGIWLDPSDITTGYTDNLGATQQTASGQSTGLRLDKRQGLALGSELVTNGSFATDLSGWGNNVSATWSAGTVLVSATAANASISQSFTTVVGQTYQLVYDFVAGNTGNSIIRVGTSNLDATNLSLGMSGGTGTGKTAIFRATATTTFVTLFVNYPAVSIVGQWDNISVKALGGATGNHVTQATGATRPEYDVITGISSDFFDGSDDGYSTATFAGGTLVNGMDLFCAIKRSSTSNMVLASNGVANASFIGKMIAADGTSCVASVGTAWSVFVDGVQVGGTNSVTCGQLNTALGSGAYHVLEVRDLDLSAWTQFTLGSYTAFILGADTGGEILAPAQSTANRAALRKWLGAKVGLAL